MFVEAVHKDVRRFNLVIYLTLTTDSKNHVNLIRVDNEKPDGLYLVYQYIFTFA